MPEITRMSAASLAAAIARGTLLATDAVDAYLARIARVDPRVEAYLSVLAADAREEARRLDAEARAGRLRGILHGVPVAVKDLLAVRGVPMSAGSTMLGRDPAPQDAAAVRRLRDAGAVVLGMTALNEFAIGTTGVNQHSRTARNPWNLERITGGSSSGSAAAVAAGLAAAAIGTDTGGSIRIPAALCGIVGLKPTFGRVDRAGVFPLAESFDTVGPMVRTVGDAALLLEALAGSDAADAGTMQTPPGTYRDERAGDTSGLRVGRLSGGFFESDVDPAVAAGIEAVARALEGAGHRVVSVTLPSAEAAHDAQLTVLRFEAAAIHRTRFKGRWAEYNPDVRVILEQGAAITPAEADDARATLRRFQADVAAVLADTPVLLAPAASIAAARIVDADPRGPRWPEIRRQLGRFVRLFNATGLPTIALPVALTPEGLPVAVQLAAARQADGLVLGVARRAEAAIGWEIPDLPRGSGEEDAVGGTK